MVSTPLKVLLVAATGFETPALQAALGLSTLQPVDFGNAAPMPMRVHLLHTGIGMVNAAYQLGRQFAMSAPDIAIQIGIAGAFAEGPAMLEVVEVMEECFPELGADSPEGYLDLQAMGFPLLTVNDLPLYNVLKQPRQSLGQFSSCKAITVNRVSGTADGIASLAQQYQPQVESMEGGAFFQACLLAGIPFRQIRSISNQVEPRNRAAWRMKEAIENLNQSVLDLLHQASRGEIEL